MIEVHFEPSSYTYYVFKLIYTNGIKSHYYADGEYHEVIQGQPIEPYMVLGPDTYEELKQHFLTEHEQPLEAKQAVIDELRDTLRIERVRVDQLLTRII